MSEKSTRWRIEPFFSSNHWG